MIIRKTRGFSEEGSSGDHDAGAALARPSSLKVATNTISDTDGDGSGRKLPWEWHFSLVIQTVSKSESYGSWWHAAL
jgi:hypothetical protein